ncbi:MAG: tetratricopeptide repeat protein, partial [Flavisolibacter sp.]
MLPILIVVVLNGSCNSPRLKAIYRAKSDSCNYRARYFFETNQYDSASYAIEESLIWDSTNWGAYNNRAILKFHTGRQESEVVADFEKALNLKPDYEISLFSLANYYEEIKAYEKAVKACKQYSFVARTHDFDSTEAIRRLQERCEEHIKKSK